MAFTKGQSGNPGGRPKITLPDGRTVQDLAREHTADAIEALVNIIGDEASPPAAVVSAANVILDRGWGRPKQDIDMGEETINVLAELLARIDGRTRAIVPVQAGVQHRETAH